MRVYAAAAQQEMDVCMVAGNIFAGGDEAAVILLWVKPRYQADQSGLVADAEF